MRFNICVNLLGGSEFAVLLTCYMVGPLLRPLSNVPLADVTVRCLGFPREDIAMFFAFEVAFPRIFVRGDVVASVTDVDLVFERACSVIAFTIREKIFAVLRHFC